MLLPAHTIHRIDLDEKKVFVDRTKEDIENAPEFDPERGLDPRYQDELVRTTVATTRNGVAVSADPEGPGPPASPFPGAVLRRRLRAGQTGAIPPDRCAQSMMSSASAGTGTLGPCHRTRPKTRW